jgi:AcrR family transcriptional regulator
MAETPIIEPSLSRRDEREAAGTGRATILSAAHEAICAVGYPELTVEEVRRRAHVSKATFYFYFKNKQHLFLQVARSVMDEMYDVAGLHYPDKDEYTRVVLANANYLDIWRREHRILGQFFAAALTDPEMGRIYAEYRAKFESRITRRLQRLIDQGRIQLTSPDLVAAALSSMVEFTAFRYFFLRDPTIALTHSFAGLVEMLSEAWFRAVYGREAPAGYPYHAAILAAFPRSEVAAIAPGEEPIDDA